MKRKQRFVGGALLAAAVAGLVVVLAALGGSRGREAGPLEVPSSAEAAEDRVEQEVVRRVEEEAAAAQREAVAPGAEDGEEVTLRVLVRRDEPEEPLAGIQVHAGVVGPEGKALHGKATDEEGTARFSLPPSSTVHLAAAGQRRDVVLPEAGGLDVVLTVSVREVTVRVRSEDGVPMGGAVVYVMDILGREPVSHDVGTTDGYGEAVVSGVSREAEVWARKEGYGSSEPVRVIWARDGVLDLRLLRMTGMIRGMVLHEDGRPAAGAFVTVGVQELPGQDRTRFRAPGGKTTARTAFLRETTVDPSGRFAVDLLERSVHVVSAREGSAAWTGSVDLRDHPTAEVTILLRRADGRISGVVKRAEGSPAAGAVVHVMGEEGWGSQEVVTDPRGRYVFEGVRPADRLVERFVSGAARRPGEDVMWLPDGRRLQPPEGQGAGYVHLCAHGQGVGAAWTVVPMRVGEDLTIDLVLDPRPSLRVRVLDELGEAVPGAGVQLSRSERDWATRASTSREERLTTGEDGTVEFAGLPVGSALVAVFRDGEEELPVHVETTMIRSAENALTIQVPPLRTGVLQGQALSTTDEPLQAFWLRASRRPIGPGHSEWVEAVDGRFRLVLPAGDYRLRLFSGASASVPMEVDATVEPERVTDVGVVREHVGGRIQGLVEGISRDAVYRTAIHVQKMDRSLDRVCTVRDGRFVTGPLPAGAYRVSAREGGGLNVVPAVVHLTEGGEALAVLRHVPEAEELDLVVEWPKAAPRRGGVFARFVDAHGKRIGGGIELLPRPGREGVVTLEARGVRPPAGATEIRFLKSLTEEFRLPLAMGRRDGRRLILLVEDT